MIDLSVGYVLMVFAYKVFVDKKLEIIDKMEDWAPVFGIVGTHIP